MSRLFGPFSVINNSVSLRACDLAGDQIAGAETAPAAVSAVIDFRNSRRFIESLPTGRRIVVSGWFRKPRATSGMRRRHAGKSFEFNELGATQRADAAAP